MLKVLKVTLIILLTLHGLIHLLGFIAYWPLAEISELPYKTVLLAGRLDIGPVGMRLVSLLWLLAGMGFLMAALALAFRRSWWASLLLCPLLLSIVVCVLDWPAASLGVWINIALFLILIIVFGLRVRPKPFPEFTGPTAAIATIPLPEGLPTPVERFYHQTYGDEIPVYHSAVMSGCGTLRLMGINFPARMRFSHVSGKDYRHYFELFLYRLPVLKVNERYLDGHNRLELPFGVVENDPCADSAANQGLWAESLGYPAIFLTDPRVRWESSDETHANLYVPYGNSEQVFSIQFHPHSGELIHFETDRCRDARTGTMRWWGERTIGESQPGQPPRMSLTAAWEDEGTPWLICDLDEIVLNADLSSYIRQSGA